ncbi:uncharacterized protein LOC101856278 isoform X1 [Aplysia californica]|uniref:Uncharacterized protein LOC101856278 isoform X1 n=1 Tax=Aplysia californica TaxID=6500 RepID=A0ABM0JX86_APLCA|nr:uncharacterized protein LOC101856278 isoform X1 [Aplysia californica]
MLKTTDQTFLHITEKNEARMFSGFTKYVSLAILAIFSVVGPALASPVSQPTIDNPCRITSSAPPEYLSLQQEITLTLNVLETLRSSCEDGVTTMTYENLLTNDEIAPLLSNPMYNLQGLPFLPANRSISEENVFIYTLQQSALNITLNFKFFTVFTTSLLNTSFTQLASKLAIVDEKLLELSCRLKSVISVAEERLTRSQRETDGKLYHTILATYETFEKKINFSSISEEKELLRYIYRGLNSVGEFTALWKDAVKLGKNIGK